MKLKDAQITNVAKLNLQRYLPPDVSIEEFDKAIKEFSEALGEENVLTDLTMLEKWKDPYPIKGMEHFTPSAIIKPASTQDVQAAVRIANKYLIPVAPISTGSNNGYGGSSPRLSGTVVMDLGRMNKVLEVNEKYGYALLEPGVGYFDLYEYLEANANTLMLDCPDVGWGSIVGNTMDRGVGYSPYGDHFMWQTGMEVVLPNGELMRTGMGALPDSNAWQLFPYGFGPYPDGLFTQSNFGIVTKMGLGLMEKPPASLTFCVCFENKEDLVDIIDIMLPLRINMAPLQNAPVLRNIILDASVISKREEWYTGEGAIPDEAIEKMKKELNLGYWNFYGTFYGPPPMIDMYWNIVQQAFGQIKGATFHTNETRKDRAGHIIQDRHNVNNGKPSMESAKLMDFIPNCGHVAFSPISAPEGKDALRQHEMVKKRADEYGNDYVVQYIVGLREMHHICLLLFDHTDVKSKQKTYDLTKLLIKEAAAEGYGEYRTHNAFMDDVMATYNWNNGALLKFHETLKDALDPNSIINPGKSGIWGKRFRDRQL